MCADKICFVRFECETHSTTRGYDMVDYCYPVYILLVKYSMHNVIS